MLEEVDCGIGKEFFLVIESCNLNATVPHYNDDGNHIIVHLDLAVVIGSKMGEEKNLHHFFYVGVVLGPTSTIWPLTNKQGNMFMCWTVLHVAMDSNSCVGPWKEYLAG